MNEEESLGRRIFVWLFTAAFTYLVCWGVLWLAFTFLGVYKSQLLGGPAHSLTPWLAAGMALLGAYENIKKNKRKIGIGKTSPTSATGRRIRNSVYTILTQTTLITRIYITNPFRGILIIGGAGAGKSKSLIEPIIQQTIQQGYAGLLYDFKFPSLARVATEANQSGLGQSIY